MKDNKIQILRAIAIISVVVVHTCPVGMAEVLCRPFFNHAVAIFVFLSGYLTREQGGQWLSFYRRRIGRVLIPYLIWSVLYTLPSQSPGEYLYNIGTTQACFTLYYAFVYIQLMLITPLLFWLSKTRWHWFGWRASPLVIIIFKYPAFYFGAESQHQSLLAYLLPVPVWITYYYMGLVLRGKEAAVCRHGKVILLAALVATFLQVAENYILFQRGIPDFGSQLKLSTIAENMLVLLLLLCFIKSRPLSSDCKGLTRIGNYSFGIYWAHTAVMSAVLLTPWYASLPHFINSALILILTLLAVAGFSKLAGPRITRWLGLA